MRRRGQRLTISKDMTAATVTTMMPRTTKIMGAPDERLLAGLRAHRCRAAEHRLYLGVHSAIAVRHCHNDALWRASFVGRQPSAKVTVGLQRFTVSLRLVGNEP